MLAIGIGEQAGGMEGALEICREFNGQRSGTIAAALCQRRGLSAQHALRSTTPCWRNWTACWPSPR